MVRFGARMPSGKLPLTIPREEATATGDGGQSCESLRPIVPSCEADALCKA